MAKTMNGVPFRQNLVPANKYSIKCPYAMTPKKITLHETDNTATAWNEIAYMIRNNNVTSYHVAIDEKEAVQGILYARNGWHSGDGANGYGNRNTVAVEICKNYDRARGTTNLNEPLRTQYSKAEQNTIKFVAQLCIDLGIVANNANIKTHNDWNGKWCPRKMLNDKRLQVVKRGIINEYNRSKGAKSAGWKKNNTGWWWQNADGSYPRNQWKKVKGVWYYFGRHGYISIGWRKIGGKWYYFHTNGRMLTGWQKVKGTWYYMNRSGAMVTGWKKLGSRWYYLNDNGAMAIGWKKVRGKWYYMNSSGAMLTGLITVAGKHYYLQRNGVLITDEVIELEANRHGQLK